MIETLRDAPRRRISARASRVPTLRGQPPDERGAAVQVGAPESLCDESGICQGLHGARVQDRFNEIVSKRYADAGPVALLGNLVGGLPKLSNGQIDIALALKHVSMEMSLWNKASGNQVLNEANLKAVLWTMFK